MCRRLLIDDAEGRGADRSAVPSGAAMGAVPLFRQRKRALMCSLLLMLAALPDFAIFAKRFDPETGLIVRSSQFERYFGKGANPQSFAIEIADALRRQKPVRVLS